MRSSRGIERGKEAKNGLALPWDLGEWIESAQPLHWAEEETASVSKASRKVLASIDKTSVSSTAQPSEVVLYGAIRADQTNPQDQVNLAG